MRATDLLARLKRLARRNGWELQQRQGKGSHIMVRLNGKTTIIANHRGDMPTGTYRKILKDLAITETDINI